MGKVSLKEKLSKTAKQKRRVIGSNKYLKPGALSELRNSKASCLKDVGKKKNKFVKDLSLILLPEKVKSNNSVVGVGVVELVKESNLQRTLKTPCPEGKGEGEGEGYESRLEALPMELLVKILCHLPHDQLRAVFHVCERVRKAVLIARQFHFNYTTPDRYRQELLCTSTPVPTEHWPFMSKEGKGKKFILPSTPKAPRHGTRPPSRLKLTNTCQVAAVLFQESAFSPRYIVPSLLNKPICKSFASNRVLIYDEELELCQAVAQNKLR